MADAHPWPAWFHDTVKEAQLLTNRTLRNFLLAHSAERWPELVKGACLYGVLCLQRDFPGQAALPLEALHEASRRLHAEAAMGAALPAIRSQFAALEADVSGFLSELDPDSGGGGSNRSVEVRGGKPQQAAALQAPPASSRARPVRSASSAAKQDLPPPPQPQQQQQQKQQVRIKAKQAAIYPDWWPKEGGAAGRRPPGGGGAPRRQRPPPRLAYSRPPTAPPSVTQDDLPTAAFLLVPPRVASGHGGYGFSKQAESRVKSQHEQRLALQRQQQERGGESRQGGGASGTAVAAAEAGGGSGGRAAAAAAAGASPPSDGPNTAFQSPRYQPEAVAKWMQHFGLAALGGERAQRAGAGRRPLAPAVSGAAQPRPQAAMLQRLSCTL